MNKRWGSSLFQVMIAVGRDPCTKDIGLEKLGVNLNK